MKKYKIPVIIETIASHVIGEVECDSLEEYAEKAEKVWESQGHDSPSTNVGNNFDLNEWDLAKFKEDDLKYCETKRKDAKKED